MAKDSNQGKHPKPQSKQSKRIQIGESAKSTVPSQRSRKGTAGDGTNNTGPRKTK